MILENIQVKFIGEEKRGISQTTGNEWSSRNILLEWDEGEGKCGRISAAVSGSVWDNSIQVGQFITADIQFRTRAFQSGYVSNDIRIVSITNK